LKKQVADYKKDVEKTGKNQKPANRKKSQLLSEQNIGLIKFLGHVHPTVDDANDPPGSRGT
jgi:hypothetical protein